MTNAFLSLAAVAVAAVFAVAATSKLLAPTRTETEFAALGLPIPTVLARLVPIAELVTVGLLLVVPRLGGPISVLLLTGFTGILLTALRSGRTITCGCLGALSDEPISGWTIARNAALIALGIAASFVETLTRPDLAVVLVCGSGLLLLGVATQLAKLRADIGAIWRIELAGEAAADEAGPELVLDLEIDLNEQIERLVPATTNHMNREGLQQ